MYFVCGSKIDASPRKNDRSPYSVKFMRYFKSLRSSLRFKGMFHFMFDIVSRDTVRTKGESNKKKLELPTLMEMSINPKYYLKIDLGFLHLVHNTQYTYFS